MQRDNTSDRKQPKYATSTATLLRKLEFSSNPVTRSVLREIIGNRIDNK